MPWPLLLLHICICCLCDVDCRRLFTYKCVSMFGSLLHLTCWQKSKHSRYVQRETNNVKTAEKHENDVMYLEFARSDWRRRRRRFFLFIFFDVAEVNALAFFMILKDLQCVYVTRKFTTKLFAHTPIPKRLFAIYSICRYSSKSARCSQSQHKRSAARNK